MRRRLKLVARALVLVGVMGAVNLWPSSSSASLDDRDDWLGPGEGDIELRTAIDFSHLFDLGRTDFAVEVAFGYFFVDAFEGGLSGSLGHSGSSGSTVNVTGAELPDAPDLPSLPRNIGVLQQALTLDGLARRRGGWHGTTEVWLRLFPFEISDEPLLPRVFAPFVELDFGPQYGEGIKPYLVGTAWLGANLYITEQLALSPRLGYALIYIADKDLRFDNEKLEHAIVTSLAFSLFLTP